ncbi:PorT family protein, partial [Candidatus Bathyarchaeota archaeon]|nr:PorT family protein [Candidatus Bathyarchaeota archaeon]
MKNLSKIFTLVIVSLLMNTAYAQWSIGIIGGPNFADLKINFVDNTITDYEVRSRTLFGVGGFFGIYLNEYLSIQLELMFVEKGGVFTQPSIQDMRIKSNQLELPLILKAGIGENIRTYIIGGVFLSFVLDATLETELAGLSLEGDLTEILKKTEFG